MKFVRTKKIAILLLVGLTTCSSLMAHSGKTDSNGGHKDNKNKSGLGSYHYHCGGYPAHLHTNGVCPYKSTSSTSGGNSTMSEQKTTPTYKEKEMAFVIDGESVKINTIIVDNTNLSELKALSEELGISMTYDSTVKTIECKKGNTSFILQIDSKDMWLNNELSTLNVAPIAYNGRTMVPARVVAEAIGKSVSFDSVNEQIVIA